MSKIVRRAWGESRLTAKRKEELAELAKRPDSEIDYSDIPPLTEKFWQNAARSPFYRPVKKQITVRIDADVLEWLKGKGPTGYQTRLNALLRKQMLQSVGKTQKRA
jgi:uncharacterized protein (DUF4415 family)